MFTKYLTYQHEFLMKLGIMAAVVNPLSANPTKWSNTLNLSADVDELFEYVWPFCGVGA